MIRQQRDDRFDNLFFSAMAAVILASVFVGFAPTYYLAGVFKAPLPNLLVHIQFPAHLGVGGSGKISTEQVAEKSR